MIAATDAVVLRGGRLPGRPGLFDITLQAGVIAAIAPAADTPLHATHHDFDGLLVLPALTDGHIHLDKTFTGMRWRPHIPASSLRERITAERTERAALDMPVQQRAARLMQQLIGFGTLALRSHIDIDPAIGLNHVEALLQLRADHADRIDMQFVAFPQSGLDRTTADLMEQALRLGVDVVGGLDPAGIDHDIDGTLATIFKLAERHGRRIDIHLHDPGLLGTFELRQIAARSAAAGLQGQVAVSHAFALGMVDATEFGLTAAALARGGVAIMTNGPGPDAMPPIGALMQAGVTVFGGSDNIRDAWSPFGNGDMLQRAGMIGYRAGFRTDAELCMVHDIVALHGRTVMGLPPLTLEVGSQADLIAIAAEDIPEAVATAPPARLIIRAGAIMTPPDREDH